MTFNIFDTEIIQKQQTNKIKNKKKKIKKKLLILTSHF